MARCYIKEWLSSATYTACATHRTALVGCVAHVKLVLKKSAMESATERLTGKYPLQEYYQEHFSSALEKKMEKVRELCTLFLPTNQT